MVLVLNFVNQKNIRFKENTHFEILLCSQVLISMTLSINGNHVYFAHVCILDKYTKSASRWLEL